MVGGEREGDSWAWFVFSEGLSEKNPSSRALR